MGLDDEGFLVCRGVIPLDAINAISQVIHDTEIDYLSVTQFVQSWMVKQAKAEMGVNHLPWIYTKYRVSNQDNIDAVGFHRDLIQARPNDITPPLYTVLAYLDPANMQVIPGSHQRPTQTWWEVAQGFRNRLQFQLEPGDLLIFDARLLHRGVWALGEFQPRRLIQVFEVGPRELINTVRHLPGYSNLGSWLNVMYALPGIAGLARIGSYIHSARGFTGSNPDNNPRQRIYYYSSEGSSSRLNPGQMRGPINYYYWNPSIDRDVLTLEPAAAQQARQQLYTSPYLLLGLMLIVIMSVTLGPLVWFLTSAPVIGLLGEFNAMLVSHGTALGQTLMDGWKNHLEERLDFLGL